MPIPENADQGAKWNALLPKFTFVDNSAFNILDPELWKTDNELKFLGVGIERGMPVTIWESTIDDYATNEFGEKRQVVATTFYLTNSSRYDAIYIQRGAPIKAVIKVRGLVSTINHVADHN